MDIVGIEVEISRGKGAFIRLITRKLVFCPLFLSFATVTVFSLKLKKI